MTQVLAPPCGTREERRGCAEGWETGYLSGMVPMYEGIPPG